LSDPRSEDLRALRDLPLSLGELTTVECARVLAQSNPVIVLPLGSTEPHGPHLPLDTDALLSIEHALRSVRALRARGTAAVVAPAVPYGVTRYAAGFAGAVTLSPDVLRGLVSELCVAYRSAGFAIVCVVNHHLEPENVQAITAAVRAANESTGGVVFANQLSARWGRTLSAEFKRGNCHAGSYESSLVLAARPGGVREAAMRELPAIATSLSDRIRAGDTTFAQMGLDRAYTGAPAEASPGEGEALYALLVDMVLAEVGETLGTP